MLDALRLHRQDPSVDPVEKLWRDRFGDRLRCRLDSLSGEFFNILVAAEHALLDAEKFEGVKAAAVIQRGCIDATRLEQFFQSHVVPSIAVGDVSATFREDTGSSRGTT